MTHILCVDISAGDRSDYDRLYERADPERQRRADRYRRAEDKLRCVSADALLKAALGTDDYRIEKTEYGKPRIRDREDFHYNLSHSGRYVVIAFGGGEVGIDVQQHDARANLEALAARCFTADERAYVWEQPQLVTRRFYQIWTGKESYLKYTGEGLWRDMRSFSVLTAEPRIRQLCILPDDGYSLSLCTPAEAYTFSLLEIRQLGRS